jgi:ATP-binding cassette subfamily F protein uup
MTVVDTVADGNDFIEIAGNKRHVLSWLGDFLFAPARARSPVKSLSGGEKNRLLLARLFTKPANLIIMDEPTNDLDLETLELLEQRLVDYDGTVLLVSHDRAFLDNVVTSVIVFSGNGQIEEFVGGYSDWIQQCKQQEANKATDVKKKVNKAKPKQQKLTYKEKQELEKIPQLIETLEAQQSALNEKINTPEFYQGDKLQIADKLDELKEITEKLELAYQRWDELEAMHASAME